MKRKIFVVVVLLFGLALGTPLLRAQQNATDNTRGQGIEISPPILELEADPGDTIETGIRVRNITDVELLAQVTFNDFLAADEVGTPRILFEEDEESPYSVKNYIDPVTDLTIAPRELRTVDITINVPEDASPGGHYGLVRFTATPKSSGDISNAVDLTASIGTLILLNVSGDAQESLEVERFATIKADTVNTDNNSKGQYPVAPVERSLFEYGPVGFLVRLNNTGNVHLQPKGSIIVKNILGRETGKLELNPSSRNVLPASIRRFDDTLDRKWMFGRYSATLDMKYGSGESTTSAVTTFWVVPWKIVAGVLLMLIVMIYFGRKALQTYKRSIIKQHQMSDGDNRPTSDS